MEESVLIDYNNENGGKDTKEILSNLLKKMLDHKLNKLEKKHAEESNSLKIMSKISQNIIISLENYSHKVRKEIYKLRHKNDLSHQKKGDKKEDKNNTSTDNNIESLINKDTKEIKPIFDRNQNKLKRESKSIDPKKEKNIFSEIIVKEKSVKKEKDKLNVFERLTSKSIGNFKKLRLTINAPISNNNHTLTAKSRGKKLNNITNKKNEGEKNSEHSPSGKDNLTTEDKKIEKSKSNSKIISTPKLKSKQLKRLTQANIENTINTIGIDSTKKLGKIKINNSKGKINRKFSKTSISKKEEKKNIESNNKIPDKNNKDKDDKSSEISEPNNENKIAEVKITNTILSKKTNNNELFPPPVKRSLKEKILLDDELIKNVNKDSLLVSTVKDVKDDGGIEEISQLNLDGLELKESINLNLDLENDSLLKKPGVDINDCIITDNNNDNKNNQSINNIKPITSIDKRESNNILNTKKNNNDNIETKSDKKIDNILLSNQKKKPVNFLDNNDDIKFSLLDNSPVDENENDNDSNKTIDLNISGLSDQLSLGEKFEAHLDEISRFLDIKDLCNLMLVNKECFTSIMNVLISKTEITIDILEEEISKLKEANKDVDFNNISISPFKFSPNSLRAVSLLNNTSDSNLIKFNKGQKINNDIFIIFGIFFIASGKKSQYLRLNNEEEKINYIHKYFKKDIENMSLGTLIEKEINGKIFDNDTISSLYRYSYKYISMISPNRFQKTNKDVAIFVFVIKNILEHIGALDQYNIKPDKEYILYNARLINNKTILDELNRFFDKIS